MIGHTSNPLGNRLSDPLWQFRDKYLLLTILHTGVAAKQFDDSIASVEDLPLKSIHGTLKSGDQCIWKSMDLLGIVCMALCALGSNLSFFEEASKVFDGHRAVHAVNMDFGTAFNKVTHVRLVLNIVTTSTASR